jgi:hypothetical protein
MRTRLELLQAARDRLLIGLTDVVDRAHVVWVEPDHSMPEASAADTHQVQQLMVAGLLQLGERLESVPWYGDSTAHGLRILPTQDGLVVLERLQDQAELAAAAPAMAAGGAA